MIAAGIRDECGNVMTTGDSEELQQAQWWTGRGRALYFQLALGACVVNGLAAKAISSVMQKGVSHAAWTLFDVSAIIWIAAFLGLGLVGRTREPREVTRIDMAVASLAVILALIPLNHTSWIGLIVAGTWAVLTSRPDSDLRRGAKILLALTVPLFWARLTFSFAGDLVLNMDAMVTGTLLARPYHGNVVQFADGSGYFQIYPACSSLVNMSLALLAWWTAVNVVGTLSTARVMAVAVILGIVVFIINIIRLVALGTYPQHFELIHGDVGSTVVSWITLVVVAGISWLGIRQSLGTSSTPPAVTA